MRSSRSGSLKEPVGKKASGLGKLMSALHQNASSLVTAKAEHNGPNQVLNATEYLTSRRNASVKLRKEETGLGAEEPVSVPSLLQDVAEAYPEVIAFKTRKELGGEWKTWTYSQFYEESQTIARAFIETGLHRHHSVAIIGDNSPYWIMANMAAIIAGGISVGIHPALPPEEMAKVCLDSKADIIVVDQEAQLKKVLLIQHKLPELKAIVQITGEPSVSDKRRLHRTHKKHIFSWPSVIELGQSLQDTRLYERLRKIAINQCCSVIYSSGRNSAPKGVMYSHDNLTWSAKMALGFIRAPGFNRTPMPGEEILLSYLPLSHISTQILDIYYMLGVAGTLVFPTQNVFHEAERFFDEIKEVEPTIMYGPPVIFERIYHRLVQARRNVTGVERFFLDWTNNAEARHHSPDRSAGGGGTSKIGDIQHKIAKNTVCKKYKESMGLGLHTVYLCRGGPLAERLLRYLSGFDIKVHSAYGQSELTSFLAANIPKRFCKFSTVGKPVPGLKLKIEKQEEGCQNDGRGDVVAVGRNVFMGYLNKEIDNCAALTEDHWLRVGDQAALDSEGFLVVHGQKQDQIIMPGGEIINPAQLECNLRLELPCISSCIVVGNKADSRLGALLALDTVVDENGLATNQLTNQTIQWFRHARFDVKNISDVIDNLETGGLKHVIQAGIDRANQLVSTSCRMIVDWRVMPKSFAVGTGELGPTLQIRRSTIVDRYSVYISQLLSQQDGRKHSFADSVGGESVQGPGGQYEPYPHQLHNILEEEERQSARNSVDKEIVTTDSISSKKSSSNKRTVESISSKVEKLTIDEVKGKADSSETNEKAEEVEKKENESDEGSDKEIEEEKKENDEEESVSIKGGGGVILENFESSTKPKVSRK